MSLAILPGLALLLLQAVPAGKPQGAPANSPVEMTATRVEAGAIKPDGRLDEAIYSRVAPISGFIQQEPREGEPSTERTEAWVFFDEKNIYVSARCFDSHPERMVMNELRRDNFNLFDNENFGVALDTFHDRRNAYMFYTTPLGGLYDGLITDESNMNRDWNTVWDARAAVDDKGWTVEMVIPFKSLRWGPTETWGVNFRRRVRWKNELSYLTAIPASAGRRGLTKLSSAATLAGVKPPSSSRAIEVKPFVTGGLATDRSLAVPNDWRGDAGFDAKVTLTSALALDATYKTDFAQVEEDLQQVNLSRFSVFFPEKREFFLEGQGIFGVGNSGGGGPGQFGPSQTPVLFFSRRIGLSDGALVPIQGGGRITGKVNGWSLGAMQMRTGEDKSRSASHTDFTVLRVKRDILKRSMIGGILTRRADAGSSSANLVYGSDLNLGLSTTLRVTAMAARSVTGPASRDDLFYQGRFEWNADRYGIEAERVRVEPGFDPGVGFVPRSDIERSLGRFRFSPRPKRDFLRRVRKFTWGLNLDEIHTASSGAFESREIEARSETEFQNGDQLTFQYTRNREDVTESFGVAGGLMVPVGSYRFHEIEARYQLGQQRKFAGSLGIRHGGFYGGTRTEYQYSQGKIEISSRVSLEPQVQLNRLDTPFGKVTTKLFSGRLTWSLSPRLVLSGLSQYNSTTHELSTNVRFRWEYQPGSDLFVVYGDGRDTLSESRIPALKTRSFVVKFTRLFRF